MPIRLNPATLKASYIRILRWLSVQRISTALPVVCELVPALPCCLSCSTVRNAELITKGVSAISRARSNLAINSSFISALVQAGFALAHVLSLKNLLSIVFVFIICFFFVSFLLRQNRTIFIFGNKAARVRSAYCSFVFFIFFLRFTLFSRKLYDCSIF